MDADTGEVIEAHPSNYEAVPGGLPDIRCVLGSVPELYVYGPAQMKLPGCRHPNHDNYKPHEAGLFVKGKPEFDENQTC